MATVSRAVTSLPNGTQLSSVSRPNISARWREKLQRLEVIGHPHVAGVERRHHGGGHVSKLRLHHGGGFDGEQHLASSGQFCPSLVDIASRQPIGEPPP